MILNSPYISGSSTITGNLNVLGTITGSTNSAISASYANNATSASYALNATSASFALVATSASYSNNSTSASYSNNSTSASYALVATSASYALVTTSASYAANADLLDGRDSLTFANTGSNAFVGTQNINGAVAITGSLTTTGAITAQTLNVQQVTSSIVYSSGSNIFGNSVSNTQSMTGSVGISGSLAVVGVSTITGVLTLNSTITNGTYTYTLPSATGTLALTSALSDYLPLTGGTLTGGLTISMANYPQLILNSSNSNGATINIQEGGVTNAKIGHLTQITGLQFSGDGTNVHQTIASTGAATFSSSVTATAFIPSGATVPTNGMYLSAANTLDFATNTTNRLTIASTGAATFSGSIAANGVMSLANDGTYGSNYKTLGLTGNTDGTHRIFAGTTDDMHIAAATSRGIRFLTNGDATAKMIINSSGNVGIGTTSPGQLLSLSSSNATGTGVNIINTDTGGYNWNIFSAGSAGTLGSAGSLVFRDSTNGVSRMVIKNDGNVGIGTTSPTAKLQINSTSAGAATVAAFLVNGSNTINTEVRLAFAANTNDDIASGRYSYISALNTSGVNGQALIFATNETGNSAVERLRIASTGAATFSSGISVGAATATTGGIQFPATAVAIADANNLDDYEEGTWTATLTCGTSGTITLSNSGCIYTKIGRLVNISGYIVVGSVSSPVGRLTLGGFPFTQIADGVPVGLVYMLTTNAYTGIPILLGNGASGATIDRNAGTGADPATDMSSAIKANSEIYFNITYTS